MFVVEAGIAHEHRDHRGLSRATTTTTSTTTRDADDGRHDHHDRPAAIAACAQVTATPGQTQGAAGTIVGTITLTPVGSATCTMEGYPVLARFSSSGASVPITMVNGLTVNLSGPPTQPPSVVTLSAGQQAEFTYAVLGCADGGGDIVRQLDHVCRSRRPVHRPRRRRCR